MCHRIQIEGTLFKKFKKNVLQLTSDSVSQNDIVMNHTLVIYCSVVHTGCLVRLATSESISVETRRNFNTLVFYPLYFGLTSFLLFLFLQSLFLFISFSLLLNSLISPCFFVSSPPSLTASPALSLFCFSFSLG